MARILHAGAELNEHPSSNIGSPDGALGGDASNLIASQTSVVRSGSRAWKFTAAGGASAGHGWPITSGSGVTTFFRTYHRFDNLPVTSDRVTAIGTSLGASGSAGTFSCRITSAGVFQLWNENAGTQVGSDSATVVTAGDGIFYRIELAYRNSTASNGYAELLINGTSVASTNTHIVVTLMTACNIAFNGGGGAWANGSVVYYDDIAINDSSGASQTSWPGAGNVVLQAPISDNAVGTGWTLGTGTAVASNAFDSVNNAPPLGVADLAALSDPKQIRNAAAAANSNYDANLTTYTNAGIAAADTINVLLPIVATAAPVTTSAKAGTIGISSNPVIANIALSATGTSGAFWSGTTAGTYPSGWKWSFGTLTYLPSVTLGTSPVARITQVTSSTRIAMVCALGMYVDYTPAVVAPTARATVVMAPYTPA